VTAGVLHVDTGVSWRGGQRQVLFLHRGLLGLGVRSRLVCSRGGELLRRAHREGLPAEGLPLRGEWDLWSALRLARIARREGVSVLHAHSSHAQALALLARALGWRGPVVATRRVDFVPRPHPLNRWKYHGVSRLVVISRAVRDIMLGFGLPPDKIRVVPSGVEPAPAPPGAGARFRESVGVSAGEKLVGNVAHLADHKGQRYLIDAVGPVVERVPGARFVIVGTGELEAPLKARAADLGLGDRVVFAGFREDVPAVLEGLDVFVMSSHLEGLGTSVMDALLAGKPVVATRAGGIPDIIEDGVHGVLVPPRDPAALAEAIVRVLENPGWAEGLARAGRDRVLREFSVEAMVRGCLRVYRELGLEVPGR